MRALADPQGFVGEHRDGQVDQLWACCAFSVLQAIWVASVPLSGTQATEITGSRYG